MSVLGSSRNSEHDGRRLGVIAVPLPNPDGIRDPLALSVKRRLLVVCAADAARRLTIGLDPKRRCRWGDKKTSEV